MRFVLFRHDEPNKVAKVDSVRVISIRRLSHSAEDLRVDRVRRVARELVKRQQLRLARVQLEPFAVLDVEVLVAEEVRLVVDVVARLEDVIESREEIGAFDHLGSEIATPAVRVVR